MRIAILLLVVLCSCVWIIRRPFESKEDTKAFMNKASEILEWAMIAQLMIVINKLF